MANDRELFVPADQVRELVTRSSVELSTTARGSHTWKVKVYDDDAQKALDKATMIDAQLRERYWQEGYGQAGGGGS